VTGDLACAALRLAGRTASVTEKRAVTTVLARERILMVIS
jgi:hypothetical protein